MVEHGQTAPYFELTNVITNKTISLAECKGAKATVVMFICNHCPYVINMQQELVEVANHYQAEGISFIAINSNDIDNYPEDAPDKMKAVAEQYNYPFPYCFDSTQEIAKMYQAACTPDFFVYDNQLKLVYCGQFDDSRPGNNVPVTGKDLCAALDAILLNKPIPNPQKPSMGCNIKWK